MKRAQIGVIGLAAMGSGLAANLAHHGVDVAVFNRSFTRTQQLLDRHLTLSDRFVATEAIGPFIASLASPRRILMMIKAGAPTDALIEQLLPLLDAGDVLIDGGNAHFADTQRRIEQAADHDVLFLGAGISGGESGARHGPSIMVGGSETAYAIAGPTLESIAAVGPRGTCCSFLGQGAVGHYVKMVHNGIEYAIMQALAEAYDLLRRGLSLTPAQVADILDDWNRGELESYLVEISARVLRATDGASGDPLIERILDTAAQKGTGKWTSQSSLDLGAPSSTITAAVYARVLSALKRERIAAEKRLQGPSPAIDDAAEDVIQDLASAVYGAVVTAYAQGFRQLREASDQMRFGLNLSEVARIWMAGCIIRAQLLEPIADAFREHPRLDFLWLAEPCCSAWRSHHSGWRRTLGRARRAGIPVPVLSAGLDAVDAYRTARLPSNLIQAQRDYFGAHTYERTDREGTFHTDWEAMV